MVDRTSAKSGKYDDDKKDRANQRDVNKVYLEGILADKCKNLTDFSS